MITKNMIKAGRKAFRANLNKFANDDLVTVIYEAMTEQKQKDALIECKQAGRDFYDEHAHLVHGHSSR